MIQDSSAEDGFEAERPRLRALAYRMLGSAAEADDAVQEAWLRYDRTDLAPVRNLAAWLTTVVTRVCLNLLRARENRREESLESFTTDWLGAADHDRVPQEEAELADSIGLALLVVLDRLSPAERVAFVLHDMFDVGFGDIAHMMERNTAAVRQLASRARAKIRGGAETTTADAARRRHAVQAYLTATRTGDFEALLTLLDPEVELRADPEATGAAGPLTLQGALVVARSALASAPRARFTVPALVDGDPALVMAPLGRLCVVLRFTLAGSTITAIDITAAPSRLRAFDIALG
ncbi:sigma-70 family RNA polymerase sigma factor [Actinomadura terrae]|uniref:sigma-70 family RNA polymerase sigma factor n=1 Tax=Actinomadura terrae TaxID=604353 RepID=UPI001FA6B7D6|nr:sigma-70 family RNA polymerase sigma factor [Actinomadura terrae]